MIVDIYTVQFTCDMFTLSLLDSPITKLVSVSILGSDQLKAIILWVHRKFMEILPLVYSKIVVNVTGWWR